MKKKTKTRASVRKSVKGFDAFISHSSADREAAAGIEDALGRGRAWFDRSDIRLGALLGRELLSHLRKSRALVLVWSKSASASPWVQIEWISAVNLGKTVIPFVLDRTPLPQCLANTLRQSSRVSTNEAMGDVVRTIRGRLPRGGSVSPAMRSSNSELDQRIDDLGRAQEAMFMSYDAGNMAGARRQQRRLDREAAALVAKNPLHPRVATIWAYNAKNGVILDNNAEINAGIRIVDERLAEARKRFLRALCLDPFDAEPLNGLGTIAYFGHDLETAEFLVRAALRRSPGYAAAINDLKLILQFKRRNTTGSRRLQLRRAELPEKER